jgi:hypothetical protein
MPAKNRECFREKMSPADSKLPKIGAQRWNAQPRWRARRATTARVRSYNATPPRIFASLDEPRERASFARSVFAGIPKKRKPGAPG